MPNSEESPQKKSKMEASPSSALSSLPDDVALNCVARVSRSDLGALSLASKSCRSPDIYKLRSLISCTETCVYVCLKTPLPDSNPRWYILRRRKTLDPSSDLIPISSLPSQPAEASSVVVLDWGIYVIGGFKEGYPTSDVWLLDCRTHTWRIIPSMRLARANAAAGVVDGKIYVLGGHMLVDYSNWGEVFDPKTQTWNSLPLWKEPLLYIHDSVVRDQKVYAVDGLERTFYYSPSQEELDLHEPEKGMYTKVVKNLDSLKQSLSCSKLRHFDKQIVALWVKKRIECQVASELKDLLPGARLSNSGPKMVLFWDVIKRDRLEIWCAQISLERRLQEGEVWGNIEWSNPVMTVDHFFDRYKVLYSASVTL